MLGQAESWEEQAKIPGNSLDELHEPRCAKIGLLQTYDADNDYSDYLLSSHNRLDFNLLNNDYEHVLWMISWTIKSWTVKLMQSLSINSLYCNNKKLVYWELTVRCNRHYCSNKLSDDGFKLSHVITEIQWPVIHLLVFTAVFGKRSSLG